MKNVCSAPSDYILLESHTQLANTEQRVLYPRDRLKAYYTSDKTHKNNKSLLRKYYKSQHYG